MKQGIFFIWMMSVACLANGQSEEGSQSGQVTFVTSSSVYVRFEHTENIEVGDTLQLDKTLSGCLVVTNKSSISCVCQKVQPCEVSKGDQVSFQSGQTSKANPESPKVESQVPVKPKNPIYGMASIATDMNQSSTDGQIRRDMFRLSLSADKIKGSGLSMESYLTYRRNNRPGEAGSFQNQELFNIYKLALKYDIDSTLWIAVGRRVNNKVTSLGTTDGLQVEKSFGRVYAGTLVGFRPDIFDNAFNTNLLQYGAYGGIETTDRNFSSSTTLGLLEQKNGSAIDRRYAYFQHNSYWGKSLNLFSSFEVDLYDNVNGVATNGIRLTNFYASARYRVNSKLNFSLSYDNRKRILFYETFRSQIEDLLADDIARQGIRLGVNGRLGKNLYAGVTYSKRFQSNGENASDNINTFVSLAKVPSIGGRLTFNMNMNQSAYLSSKVVSLRHSRAMLKNKMQVDMYVRNVDYQYTNREIRVMQQYYGAGLSYTFNRKLRLYIQGELAVRKEENNTRISARLIKRF